MPIIVLHYTPETCKNSCQTSETFAHDCDHVKNMDHTDLTTTFKQFVTDLVCFILLTTTFTFDTRRLLSEMLYKTKHGTFASSLYKHNTSVYSQWLDLSGSGLFPVCLVEWPCPPPEEPYHGAAPLSPCPVWLYFLSQGAVCSALQPLHDKPWIKSKHH